MTWLRFDDSFYDHPKIIGLSHHAHRVWTTSIGYSGRHRTDGFISNGAMPSLGCRNGVKQELVKAALWDVVDGGIVIHDYLKYNPSKAEIEEETERKRAAGRKGAQATHGGKHDA